MKTVKLNLEDKQSWRKFQHVLTSFASDYIDVIAPERAVFKLQEQVLTLCFTLIKTDDRNQANLFTQNLEAFLSRLQLVGVRRVELEFLAIAGGVPTLSRGFDLNYIPAASLVGVTKAIASKRQSRLNLFRASNLVRQFKTWLASPQVQQNIETTSKLVIRDPKNFLAKTGDLAKANFIVAINWVDTFPWEEWATSKVNGQKRRHQRNMVKALVEDFLILAVALFLLVIAVDFLSGPSINLANVPAYHYDKALDSPLSRCGFPGLSKKNYVCLNRGMSYKQVVNILGAQGKPLGIDKQFGDRAVVIAWEGEKGDFNATFKDDRLVAKAQRNLS